MNYFQRRCRNSIAAILAFLLKQIGMVDYNLRQLHSGIILPIYFHNPDRIQFQVLIEWFVKNKFQFISTEHLIKVLNGNSTLHRKALWVTFDDGWRNNLINVIPTLKKFNVPATFFLATDAIESDMGVNWFSLVRLNSKDLPFPFNKDVEKLWHVSEVERRRIVAAIEKDPSYIPPREMMTVEEVRQISKIKHVTIGCHTVHHGNLKLHTETELDEEISISQKKLEYWSGQDIKYFAFPKGLIDTRMDKYLKKYQFEIAATTNEYLLSTQNLHDNTLFRLPRYPVLDDGYFSEMLCQALGIWQPIIRKIKSVFI